MGTVYPWLKLFHVACACASVAGFLVRGLARFVWHRPALPYGVARIRDVIDGLLLLSAIALAMLTGQYPFAASWLTAKILALAGYIMLGIAAFRLPGDGWAARAAWGAALIVAGYIVSVALTKTPLGFLGALKGV